ncbi:hypothetical protein ACFLTM_04480, partial [Candidatus Bipolaricaulota bacterium]
ETQHPATEGALGLRMVPNPLRDWAEFRALGEGITGFRVRVFDLTGRQVYTSELTGGSAIDWNGIGDDGTSLANGVYLCVAELHVGRLGTIGVGPIKIAISR